MVIAFVLITTKPGAEKEVYDSLKNIPEVTELHPIFGEYDLIIKLNSDNADNIGELVVQKIRVLDGITDTKTFIGIKL
jgi:DNA-binding Lrp family transcriptional regulator